MADEIERKFLVHDSVLPLLRDGTEFSQGYLADNDQLSARVRLAGSKAWITVKGRGTGITRPEFEYPIPPEDARYMLDNLCTGALIRKTRYRLQHADMLWEVDVFGAANAGLIVAEVELESEDQVLQLPEWVAQEVTDDPRYLNVNLALQPFGDWDDA
jgi:CYTH domain-containing protein